MTPADLLADLRAGGVELETDGHRLRWRPPFLVSPAKEALIVSNKPALIALLRAGREGGRCPGCRWWLDSARRCPKCFDRLCVACGKATGSYLIERCLPCGISPANVGGDR